MSAMTSKRVCGEKVPSSKSSVVVFVRKGNSVCEQKTSLSLAESTRCHGRTLVWNRIHGSDN